MLGVYISVCLSVDLLYYRNSVTTVQDEDRGGPSKGAESIGSGEGAIGSLTLHLWSDLASRLM